MNYWLICILFSCDIFSNLFFKQEVLYALLASLVIVMLKKPNSNALLFISMLLFLKSFLVNSCFGITGLLVIVLVITALLARKYLQDRDVIVYAIFFGLLCLQLWYNGDFQEPNWLTAKKIIANIIIANRILKLLIK